MVIVVTTEEMTETEGLDQILAEETKVAVLAVATTSTLITKTAIQRSKSTTIVSKALTKQQLNDCKYFAKMCLRIFHFLDT